MPKRSLIALFVLAATATQPVAILSAQAPAGSPKPRPEHKELDYFVGTWHTAGEITANPVMSGGKITATVTCEPFPGGFHIVCRTEAAYPVGQIGPKQMIGFFGYSPSEKVYTYYAIDSHGMSGGSKGPMTGDTWVFEGGGKVAGKQTKSRYIAKKINADAYTFRWKMSAEDGPYTVMMVGTDTRVKPAK